MRTSRETPMHRGISLLLTALLAGAQRSDELPRQAFTQPAAEAPPIDLMPKGVPADFPLRFSMLEWDFGRVSDSDTIRRDVWFKNVCQETVRFTCEPSGPTCTERWYSIA